MPLLVSLLAASRGALENPAEPTAGDRWMANPRCGEGVIRPLRDDHRDFLPLVPHSGSGSRLHVLSALAHFTYGNPAAAHRRGPIISLVIGHHVPLATKNVIPAILAHGVCFRSTPPALRHRPDRRQADRGGRRS
jgi:hypothetical protein